MIRNLVARPNILWLLLLATVHSPCSAQIGDWFEFKSANFTVYTDVRDDNASRYLSNLEIFRQLARAVLGLPDEPENEQLKIVIYGSQRDYAWVWPHGDFEGFFYHSIFDPRIMVRAKRDPEIIERVLFHEFVHHLLNEYSSSNYPRWYLEGLAELLATVRLDTSNFRIGQVVRLGTTVVMPNIITGLAAPATVRSVIDGNWDNLLSGFHITAWLMTHYFVIESSDNESLRMQTREYLARYDAGDDPVVAFVESYGSIETIQRAINKYRNLKEFPVIQFPRFDYAGPIKTRELSPGEALYLLGDIAMEHNSIRRAHEYFDEFRALEIESPLAMKVESRRSIAFIHQGEIEKGDTIIEELVARDPNDPDVLADLAHYSYDRYLNSVNDSEPADSGHLDRAIEFGVHAIELEPQDSEALYYLGLAYERRGDLQLAADTLLMLYDINPRIPALKWNLARVAVKIDQIDFASRLISKLISAVPSTEARDLLRKVQQRIESEELDNDSINDLFQEPVWASIRLDY